MRGATTILHLLYAGIAFAKCPPGAVVGPVGRCYIIRYSPQESWQNATEACTKEGGTLASIHSKETNDFLGTMLMNYGLNMWQQNGVWIGCQSDTPDVPGSWRWADNSTFNYSSWEEGND